MRVLGSRNFWLLGLLCVLFYSSIIAFKKFAGAILIPRFAIPAETAGWMVSMLPFATVVFAPLFGLLVDRFGRGTRWMLLGSLLAALRPEYAAITCSDREPEASSTAELLAANGEYATLWRGVTAIPA